MADDRPLDPYDPRFGGASAASPGTERDRTLVESRGPGPSLDDPKVRILRVAIPLLALGAVGVIVMVFFSGLNPGESSVVIGPTEEIMQVIVDGPRRVCFNDANPCAWLTDVEGEIVAFNTNGPLAEEYGRQGVGWCASSGYFGSNSTGSRWDQQGRIVDGPSPRSLDRFDTQVDDEGNLVVRYAALTAGLADWQIDGDVSAPDGPPCTEIPFDRDPDLDLTATSE